MPYELKLEKFSGPLEKLLELIEERKMEIGEISMAQVTDDFLKFVKSLTGGHADLPMFAGFIAVASRLIFIKSKYLLPDLTLTEEEEEAGIKDLEKRLKLYQELRPAMKVMAALWRKSNNEFSRPYFLARGFAPEAGSGIFYPGGGLDIQALSGLLGKIFETLQSFTLETETIREKIMSIEEKIAEIVKRLEIEGETNFVNLAGSKSRMEIIVVFLAILHLAREQLVLLEQAERFSEIVIKKSQP